MIALSSQLALFSSLAQSYPKFSKIQMLTLIWALRLAQQKWFAPIPSNQLCESVFMAKFSSPIMSCVNLMATFATAFENWITQIFRVSNFIYTLNFTSKNNWQWFYCFLKNELILDCFWDVGGGFFCSVVFCDFRLKTGDLVWLEPFDCWLLDVWLLGVFESSSSIKIVSKVFGSDLVIAGMSSKT